MTKSEQAIVAVYCADENHWRTRWRRSIIRQLAAAGRSYLRSISPLQVDPQILRLQRPDVRAQLITIVPAVPEIATAIAGTELFRNLVGASCETFHIGPPSRIQLERLLSPLVTESLRTPAANAEIASVQDYEIYNGLGEILAEELFHLGTNPGCNEAVILNHALLIYHLRHCRLPFERLVETLREMSTRALGFAGHLISIQNTHRPSENTDDFAPPVVAFAPVKLPNRMQAQSGLLGAVQQEATNIAGANGYFHRTLNRQRPVVPQLLDQARFATQEVIELMRGLLYPQYEHTALVFMSLAAIDFLLRSHPPAQVPPDQPLERIIRDQPGLSADLRGDLEKICSTDGWNIRNRSMHGSFLDVEARQEELLRESGILAHFGVPRVDLSRDGSLPANVSALVLHALDRLAQELEPLNQLFDRSWTDHYLLSPEELEFARTVPCDLLRSLEEGEAWRTHIRDYIRAVTPGLSIPLQIGMTSWITPNHGLNSLPGFYFLMLLFEPFIRVTLHFGGSEILQKGPSTRGGSRHYRVQYKMLDERGLISAGNIEWLTRHLEPQERAYAERVLRLAVKCRDAIAHGAVFEYTEEIRRLYGHLLVKGIQLVVEAGMHHLRQAGGRVP
ncbi:MAG TPA: hypothetical protein VN673_15845 [Clostridia bacterium]|nr:hypothetical protein [Clostridia bacterium]